MFVVVLLELQNFGLVSILQYLVVLYVVLLRNKVMGQLFQQRKADSGRRCVRLGRSVITWSKFHHPQRFVPSVASVPLLQRKADCRDCLKPQFEYYDRLIEPASPYSTNLSLDPTVTRDAIVSPQIAVIALRSPY